METMLTNVLYIKLCVFALLEMTLNKECCTHFVYSEYFYIFYKFEDFNVTVIDFIWNRDLFFTNY